MNIKTDSALRNTATACAVGVVPHLACAPLLMAFTTAATSGASAVFLQKFVSYEWNIGIALSLPILSTVAWAALRLKKSNLTEKVIALSAGALSLAFAAGTHVPHYLAVQTALQTADIPQLRKMWSNVPEDIRSEALKNIQKGGNCFIIATSTAALCSDRDGEEITLPPEQLPLCLR